MITMPLEIKNVSLSSEIVLKTGIVIDNSDFIVIRLISARAPSEKGHNCWPKYESTCDFLPNHDAVKNNAADMSGPSGLITLTHMQCEGGFTYVKLTGDLSCPNCDSNIKVKFSKQKISKKFLQISKKIFKNFKKNCKKIFQNFIIFFQEQTWFPCPSKTNRILQTQRCSLRTKHR